MQPALRELDPRDYFWLVRDRTNSTLAGVQMVSPLVRRLFDQLTGESEGEQHMAARDADHAHPLRSEEGGSEVFDHLRRLQKEQPAGERQR